MDEKDRKRFNNSITKNPETECWDWEKYTDHSGYGTYTLKRKTVRAHRLSYTLFIGPIPEGYDVHHVCRNRCCVNPVHLKATTHKENMEEAADHGSWDGEKNGNAKLDGPQVIEIIKLYRAGKASAMQLSKQFNVSRSTIYNVVTGKTYRWVNPANFSFDMIYDLLF